MLLRVAGHLYWMGRYIERVENTARAAAGAYDSLLLPRDCAFEEGDSLLTMFGQRNHFPAGFDAGSAEDILRFFILDPENPFTILSSLRAARENGRATCGTISLDAWESINSIWIDISAIDPIQPVPDGTLPTLSHLREGTQLFRGVNQTDLIRDESSQWIGLGTLLERADFLARILGTALQPLLKNSKGDSAYDASMAILRWAGAVEIYRKHYHNGIDPHQVIDLLVLNEEAACSLHSCLDQILGFSIEVSDDDGPALPNLAVDLHAPFHGQWPSRISAEDLSPRLIEFSDGVNRLSEKIAHHFQGAACV
jgi:uncharacterized alpha-E superfamily protein